MNLSPRRGRRLLTAAAACAAVVPLIATSATAAAPTATNTKTPIQHLVVIFQENVSFDHYFGTYPKAANTDGTKFTAAANTPAVNGLTADLLTHNPNSDNPARLGGATQQVTCDQDHEYKDEQKAFDGGLMDKFVQFTNVPACSAPTYGAAGLVMDYYDGNSVAGLWNYAQRFSMSDNSYGTTFGPSTPGAINLISGQTYGVDTETPAPGKTFPTDEVLNNAAGAGTLATIIGDPQPQFDDCSSRDKVAMASTNQNIGDLLNAKGVTWGFFEGGFKPTATVGGKAICGSSHNIGAALGGTGKTGALPYGTKGDYIPHHEPFQYYASTANPHHLAPSSVDMIGKTDQANHQYDLSDFWASVNNGTMPAVSYLKAAGYQDGHAGYSDPIDEQNFVVDAINRLQKSPDWKNTAVVIAYDDSDGWYDHQASQTINGSTSEFDALSGDGVCGHADNAMGGIQGRCGYGPRLPLLVISPYAKQNFVDHTQTDQSSILRFIESNWRTGLVGGGSFDSRAGSLSNMFDFANPDPTPLVLDPMTGAVK